jgi:uncharacterized protein YoxC
MKRSFLMPSLVLALATALAACGGASGDSNTPASSGGDSSSSGGGDSSADSGDPVAALQKMSDDLQKSVDAVITPITGAGDVLDGFSVAKLNTDLKPQKGKLNVKLVMAQVVKVVNGQDADVASLQLDADSTTKLNDKIQKLKDLVSAVKNVDQNVKDVGAKIADAATKAPPLVAKALASAQLTLKNPLAGGDKKKDAQATMDKLNGIKDGFMSKLDGWKTDLAGLAAKAKDIPAKLSALK